MTAERFARSSRKYAALALASARRALAERSVLAGRAIFLGVILFIFARVWETVLAQGALQVAGAGKPELIWYLAVTEWCLLSVPHVYLAIEADVRSGDIACRLVRPVSYVGAQLAEALGETGLRLLVLGPIGAAIAYALAGGWPDDPRGLWLALPLGVLSSTLAVFSTAAIGLSAFWIVDTSPIYWIWQKLAFVLGGLLLPLELFPDWLRALARFSPFPAMLWGPGRMAFGFAPGAALTTLVELLAWGTVVAVGLAWLSRFARARLTVGGG
ncbi:MAG: ABC-2 family transporter protein [Myxococcota bacterium]